jgi:hypothetical protein
MDKRVILGRLVELMTEELEAARRASKDAAAYATDEEAKARSQWETQGLEASYLAAGQAGHAKELMADLQRLRASFEELVQPRHVAEIGTLLACSLDGETDWYFIAPVGGGEEFEVEGREITIMTPRSPLFSALKGKTRGEKVRLNGGAAMQITALH